MWIAVTSIAIAVAVLELTLAVASGFRTRIIQKVSGFDADIVVTPAYSYQSEQSDTYLSLTPALEELIWEQLPQFNMSLSLRYPAVLKTNDNFSAIVFRAFDNRHDFSFEQSNLTEGTWPDFTSPESANQVVISSHTANALNLATGDKIDTYFMTEKGIKMRRPVVAGIYASNFGENDRLVAYTSLPWLQKAAGIDSLSGTILELRPAVSHYDSIPAQAQALQTRLIEAYRSGEIPKLYPVDNITHTGSVYFNWLDLLNTNVVVIFILMTAVAGFTLISTFVTLILERVRTIGLLRAIGMRRGAVKRVFILIALRCVGWGLLAGNIIGIGIIFAQDKWEFLPLNPEMYYLSSVPMEIHFWQIAALNLGVVATAWLVLAVPAGIVSTISPAQTMRYE